MSRALIVIDVQNDYAGGAMPIEHPPVELSLANIGRAMDAARAAGVPVVVVQHIASRGAPFLAQGTAGAELHEAVASRHRDHYLAKTMASAFSGTDLEAWLKERGIGTIAIAGYMSHNCDLATAIQAAHAGFQVEFLSDATGSLPYANQAGAATAEEIHRVVSVVLHSSFAAVMTTAAWVELLASGAQSERGTIFASNRQARAATAA
jgi:nicotinamidase-related amidase